MVVIIHGGHRKGICYEAATAFDEILKTKALATKLIDLRDCQIDYCCGNQPCYDSGECVFNDYMAKEIVPLLTKSKALIFFTPTYFNMPPALLKNFIDRCNFLLTNEDRAKLSFGAWVSGQTDERSIEDCFNNLATFAEICNFPLMSEGKILRVEANPEQMKVNKDDIEKLEILAAEITTMI